jgi:regulator of sigma E protease
MSWLVWVFVALELSLLVIVHEGGHYLAARAFGMRVLRFSIGIGPSIFRYQPKDSPTVFQVCAIPFLAYVQVDGMNPTEEIDPKDPGLFANKSVFARIMTIFAGPLANYLLASLMVFFLVAIGGLPRDPTRGPMIVGEVGEGTPAAEAGLQVGDVVIEADGHAVHNVDDLIAATRGRAGQPTVYRVRRGDQELDPITITPATRDGRGIIGVSQQQLFDPAPLSTAAARAITLPFELTILQVTVLSQRMRELSTEGISGPVGMGRQMAASARRGAYDTVWTLVVISVALGFFNLLPFPALDGGRLGFLLFELVTRRRANQYVENIIHMVGIVVLLCFAAYVTFYRDIPG